MTLPALDRAVVTTGLRKVRHSRRPMFRKLAKLAKLASALKMLGDSVRLLAKN